jgi:tRNA(fMet)-specific endonuclease VapC
MKYMLDTNICIYLIKQKPIKVLNKLRKINPDDVCISSITLSELEYGIQKSNYPERNKLALTEFLIPLTILSYDELAADEYGKIRAYLEKQGKIIGSMDMLIAAHALSLNLTLVTNNTKEFERIKSLKIDNWV